MRCILRSYCQWLLGVISWCFPCAYLPRKHIDRQVCSKKQASSLSLIPWQTKNIQEFVCSSLSLRNRSLSEKANTARFTTLWASCCCSMNFFLPSFKVNIGHVRPFLLAKLSKDASCTSQSVVSCSSSALIQSLPTTIFSKRQPKRTQASLHRKNQRLPSAWGRFFFIHLCQHLLVGSFYQ